VFLLGILLIQCKIKHDQPTETQKSTFGTPGAWHTCYKVETDMLFQICIFHDGCKQGIDQQIFNRKLISCKITHPQSLFST